MRVIAEGVEDADTLERLRSLQCVKRRGISSAAEAGDGN